MGMQISAIRAVVEDAVAKGILKREETREALDRIERAEAGMTTVENNADATIAQKVHALDELNAASEEATDLLRKASE